MRSFSNFLCSQHTSSTHTHTHRQFDTMSMPGQPDDPSSTFMVVFILLAVLAVLSFVVSCCRCISESSSDSPSTS